jgi:uncharacterized membrane protein (DUF2068 family)
MVLGAIVPVIIVIGIAGLSASLALYGLETTGPMSVTGIVITALFALKGIVAYGLWTEKHWAVDLGIIDAILGIVICSFVMFVYPFVDSTHGFAISFRLELAVLIPYLLKLKKLQSPWKLSGLYN